MIDFSMDSPFVFPLPTIDDIRINGRYIDRISRIYEETGIRYTRIDSNVIVFAKRIDTGQRIVLECSIPLRLEKGEEAKPPKDIDLLIIRSRVLYRGTPCSIPFYSINETDVILSVYTGDEKIMIAGRIVRDTIKVKWVIVNNKPSKKWRKIFKTLRTTPLKNIEIFEVRNQHSS